MDKVDSCCNFLNYGTNKYNLKKSDVIASFDNDCNLSLNYKCKDSVWFDLIKTKNIHSFKIWMTDENGNLILFKNMNVRFELEFY